MFGNKIQADYDELANVANQFAQEAAGVEQLKAKIMSLVGELEGGGWIGRGAQSFYSEMYDLVEPSLSRLVDALESAAEVTKRVSQIIQNAEQEASTMFGRR
jgi:WXG100 family type VII secretion target